MFSNNTDDDTKAEEADGKGNASDSNSGASDGATGDADVHGVHEVDDVHRAYSETPPRAAADDFADAADADGNDDSGDGNDDSAPPSPPAPPSLSDALGAISELRRRVLDRQRFRGYSGTARAAGGALALLAAVAAHVAGAGGGGSGGAVDDARLLALWGVVFTGAATLNYGAVLWWRATGRRDIRVLAPALEPLPVLLVGGILSAALHWGAGRPELLPGMWMCVFGLTQFCAKYALPQRIRLAGWYYIAAGAACLCAGGAAWREPLVMGGVFAFGEFAGGLILHFDEKGASLPFKDNEL